MPHTDLSDAHASAETTIPVSDAAARLDAVVEAVAADGPVLLERNGVAVAAVVHVSDLADLRRLRELERRREAFERLERVNEEWAASELGYDDVEAERIGKELGNEVNRTATERLRRESTLRQSGEQP